MLDGTRGSDINNNSPFMSQGAAAGVEVTVERSTLQDFQSFNPNLKSGGSRHDYTQNSEPKFRYCPWKKGQNGGSTPAPAFMKEIP